ncbi:MAG: hypothetical protein JWM02_2712 [Frankiales bacterium]|nr:hypothetical protein [Frankiales bacterium]
MLGYDRFDALGISWGGGVAQQIAFLKLLNHARHRARFDAEGRIVTLDRRDRNAATAAETDWQQVLA